MTLLDTGSYAHLLADWLVNGKPELGWRGDPRLELEIGVITAAKSGYRDGKFYRKGDVVAQQFQVWRHNESGKYEQLFARRVSDWLDIIPTLIESDPRTPGFRPVMDRVEEANAKVEAEKSREFQEAWGEMTEHLWSIASETFHGKQTHYQVGGSRDAGK
jgi:hypothetical protein